MCTACLPTIHVLVATTKSHYVPGCTYPLGIPIPPLGYLPPRVYLRSQRDLVPEIPTGVLEATWYQRYLPPPPVNRLTDTCENITLTQLLLRVVKNKFMEFSGNISFRKVGNPDVVSSESDSVGRSQNSYFSLLRQSVGRDKGVFFARISNLHKRK